MAFTDFLNGETPSTGAVALWTVIEMWVAAGASVLADSDGTTYDADGGQVTSGGSGAGGLGNTSAWVRVQFPDGREITIQRGANNQSWRIKYSAQSHFTGGSPGAARTPTAADEALRFGGGSDASPTYATWFASDNSYKLYGGAGGAADGWWFGTALNSGGAPSAGAFMDPLSSSTTGDDDPCPICIVALGTSFTKAALTSSSASLTSAGVYGWLKYGLSGAGYVAIPALVLADSAGDMWPNAAGTNLHTAKDALILIQYGRKSSLSAPTGPKGTSKFVSWNASSRSTLETYSIATTRDRIVFGDVNFPWNGEVVL